jgi:hypothetical protein
MSSFRLRARTATNIVVDSPKPLANAGLPHPVEMVPIKPMLGSNYIDVRSHGYSEDDAKAEAKKLADMLLLLGVKAGYGVDLAQGKMDFSEELKANHFKKHSEHLVPDNGGLTVYDEPAFFMRVGGHVTVSDDAVTFENYLGQVCTLKFPLTERQRIAAELINDTYFEPSPNAQFVLSITAVEALCPEKIPSPFFQSIVGVVISLIRSATRLVSLFRLEDKGADLDELRSKLEGLQKRGSVRQGYMTKLRTLFNNKRAKEFDKLYDRRSKFVHDGRGRGSFIEDAPRAREIATELLFADIATNPQA